MEITNSPLTFSHVAALISAVQECPYRLGEVLTKSTFKVSVLPKALDSAVLLVQSDSDGETLMKVSKHLLEIANPENLSTVRDALLECPELINVVLRLSIVNNDSKPDFFNHKLKLEVLNSILSKDIACFSRDGSRTGLAHSELENIKDLLFETILSSKVDECLD
ncbi:hypothetical protein HDU83_006971 [Entophlyctis luteolus]|nr:hypothetical protein HDU83_006971 [Entophlyctis luteolus]KAJ3388252.1 hypothetical protein HDU84_000173 [Entophlyctis sp. JEL0112]